MLNKINGLLLTGEKVNLSIQAVLSLLIALLDIAFLAGIMFLAGIQARPPVGKLLPPDIVAYGSSHLLIILLSTIFLFALKNFAGYRITAIQYQYAYRISHRIAQSRLLQFLKGNYADYIHTDSAIFLYRIANQPIEIAQYVVLPLQQIFVQGMLVALSAAAMFFYKPILMLLIGAFILPAAVLINLWFRTQTRAIRHKIRHNHQKSTQHLKEALAGFVESHVFGKAEFLSGRYTNAQSALNRDLAEAQSTQSRISRTFETIAIGVILLYLLLCNRYPSLQIGTVAGGLLLASAYKVIPGMVKIVTSTNQLRSYQHILNAEMADYSGIPTMPTPKIREIILSDVAFSYHQKPLFKHLNFTLQTGDLAVLMAPSGKGKSTLINLLLGFLDPQQGMISFNSRATDQQTRMQYLNRVSYVKQTPFLIHDTLLKNISLSDGITDHERLHEVLELSGLDKLINEFPQGIDQLITENGGNLSGGQRQRVMLARALYHDFDLLILDEPFSELDEAAELEMLGKLQMLSTLGKMILLITHNLKSLEFCNKVIQLNEEPVYAA